MDQIPRQTLQIPTYVDVDPEELEKELNEEQVAFEHFRQSFTTEEMGSIRVQKVPMSRTGTSNPGAIRGIHCFSCPVDQYGFDGLLDYIRDTYGGGMYRVMGTKSGAKGTAFNRLCEIAEPLKIGGEAVAPETGTGNMSAVMDTLGNLINDSQKRTEDLLMRVNPQLSNADPFASLERMVTMLSTLGLVGSSGGGGGMEELEKFVKLKAIVSELGGGESDSGAANFYSMMGETIKTFGGPLMAAVAAGAKTGAINPRPTPVIEQPSVETGAPEMSPENEQALKELQTQVNILVANAKAGISAIDFAGIVLNQTPDDKLEELHAFVSDETCIPKMIQVNSEVKNLIPWFEELRSEIIRLIHEETEALTIDGGETTIPKSEVVTGAEKKEPDTAPNAPGGDPPNTDAATRDS